MEENIRQEKATKIKQRALKILPPIIISIVLIACVIGILWAFLPKNDDTKKENYEFFSGGVSFDYVNNISDNDIVELKCLELYCQSDGSLSGGKYYDVRYVKDIISSYDWYDIDSFTLSNKKITINFENELGSVHGTFNDDWDSITFTDAFPPIYNGIGWRFDIREKS